jgi:hypothetical protein
LLFVIFVFIYKNYNPSGVDFFPKCPFFVLTGFKCPGCGSQRAIHHLLNLEIGQAFRQNLLLVILIPYVLGGIWFDMANNLTQRMLEIRKKIYGVYAIWIIFTVVLAFWIFRNI